jgi:hypothetical protein
MKKTAALLAAGTMLAGCTTPRPSWDTLYHQGETIPAPKQTYDPVYGVNFGVPPGWEGRMDEWEKVGRPPFSPGDVPADWLK